MDEVLVQRDRDAREVLTLTLNRPAARNAMTPALIDEITVTFDSLVKDADGTGAVVLAARGDVFSAGADLDWMGTVIDATVADSRDDSAAFDRMLRSVYDCPVPVVARVNGHAVGGGLGLVACSDVVVAADLAQFALPEVRIGLPPAVVSIYVAQRVGTAHTLRYGLTGERFSADVGRQIGLVDRVATMDDLDVAVGEVLDQLLAGGPQSQRDIKQLLRFAAARSIEDSFGRAIDVFSHARVSSEGVEGMRAFLEKRPPAWQRHAV